MSDPSCSGLCGLHAGAVCEPSLFAGNLCSALSSDPPLVVSCARPEILPGPVAYTLFSKETNQPVTVLTSRHACRPLRL
ncbi:MAG: hypothetical protein LC660_11915 [Desulfobacteraceae bacterium]|nr:hypothetical protein [Desulfobacteraceae bacterium]